MMFFAFYAQTSNAMGMGPNVSSCTRARIVGIAIDLVIYILNVQYRLTLWASPSWPSDVDVCGLN